VGSKRPLDPCKKFRSEPDFEFSMFSCSDLTFPLCHATHKQFVLDDPLPIISKEHPDRPVPIRKKEVVCLKPAFEKDFDLYLSSILWETSLFPQSLDHIQDPHDPMKRTESVGS